MRQVRKQVVLLVGVVGDHATQDAAAKLLGEHDKVEAIELQRKPLESHTQGRDHRL